VAQVARHVPGVTAATSVVRSIMFDNQGDEYTAEGVDTAALPGTLDLGTVSGSLADLNGDTVAVDTMPIEAIGAYE
jgi:putative ABC transport system permease protein